MVNGNEMISEQYEELNRYLLERINHNELDEVTIKSLVNSCVEFDSSGLSKNTMLFPNLVRPKQSVSVKFSNINFSLRLAFDIILLNPPKEMDNGMDIIRFVVRLIKLAVGEMVEILDEDMTMVLKAIYMLSYDNHGADIEKIKKFCKDNGMENQGIESILNKLENIKCIQMENEEYKIAEKLILNL